MATYGLKYSQYLEQGGVRLQIKVYVKDYSGASYGMAHITGASLQIVGGQADVLSPVLKTAFSWSMADCWDEGTTRADGTTCVDATGQKCGKWEEFYTNDATKFKVELSVLPDGGTAAVIWTGFVTQDSWSESLVYRGSVTITARDMLGALQDTEFNLTGRVSVLDIVQGALSACACPMALSYTAGHFLVNSNGSDILAHTVAASTFAGDNWQTVLEDVLESLGLVLRYDGANSIVLTSYRYIKADTLRGTHGCEFTSRSGLRSLNPAVKEIVDVFEVNFVSYNAPDPAAEQFARTGGTITCSMGSGSQAATGQLYAYNLTRAGGEGWAGNLAIPMYGTHDGVQARGMFWPTNVQDTQNNIEASYINPRLETGFKFSFEQDGPLVLARNGATASATFVPYTGAVVINEIRLRVEATASGTTYYLNEDGVWVTAQTYIIAQLGEEIDVPVLNGGGDYKVVVKSVRTAGYTDNVRPVAPVLAALLFNVAPLANSTSPTEYKTTTIYNEENNVSINRSPKVGSANLGGCVDFYENVLALGNDIAPDGWNWPGQSSYYPLAVMIQAQVLVFNAAAASVFTGTMHDTTAGRAAALPGYGINYYQRDCVPVNATYDFVSGLVGQTTLREVYTWEQVWGASFAPQYTQRSGAGRGSTSATGAGGSSVSPGGGVTPGGGVQYFEPHNDGIILKADYDYVSVPDVLLGDDEESLTSLLAVIAGNAAQGAAAYGYFNNGVLPYNHGGTGFSTYTKGDLLYASANNTLAKLAANSTATKKFLTMTSSVPSWGSLAFGDLPTLYWANVAVSSSSSTTTEPTVKSITIGGATLTWVAPVGTTPGYLKINSALLTDGDQIVGSGTPGGGGGGGQNYLRDLYDVSGSVTAKPSADSLLVYSTTGTDKNGGSGAWEYNTLNVATNKLINSLTVCTSTPVDDDYYVSQYANGGTTKTTYHRRKVSVLYTYIKNKLAADNIYLPLTAGTSNPLTGVLSITNSAVYSLYLSNTTSGATQVGIRFRLGGTTNVGAIYCNSSGEFYNASNKKFLTEGNFISGTNYVAPQTTIAGYGITDAYISSSAVTIGTDTVGSSAAPIGYATQATRLKRYEGTASTGGYDLNTMLSGGGITSQYNSGTYWANGPTGMSYGGAAQFNTQSSNTLSLQLAWDVTHNVEDGTKSLWWRDRNNLGWGGWRLIYHSGNSNKSDVAWACSGLTIGDFTSATNPYIQIDHVYSSTNYRYFIQGYQGTLRIGPNNYTSTVSFDYSGRVGIGTQPAYKFEIYSSTASAYATSITGGSACQVRAAHSDGYGMIIDSTASTSGVFLLRARSGLSSLGGSGTEVFCANADGRVGFGTASPGTNVEIVGQLRISRSGYNSMNMYIDSGGAYIQQGSGTYMYVNGTYGVGINKVPTCALDVTGEVCASDKLTSRRWFLNTNTYISRGNLITGGLTADDIGIWVNDGTNKRIVRVWCSDFNVQGPISSTGDQVISSDINLKTHFKDITLTSEQIANAPAVSFDWKDGHGHSFGSIAQYWKPLVPEAVLGEEGNLTLAYGQIALVNTIIEAREIDVLKKRVAELEAEVQRLRS